MMIIITNLKSDGKLRNNRVPRSGFVPAGPSEYTHRVLLLFLYLITCTNQG